MNQGGRDAIIDTYMVDGSIPIEELVGPLNDVERRFAPPHVWVRGRVDMLRGQQRVSIVGSRDAGKESLQRAGRLATILAEGGIVVVSGLARGVDTEAHRATMSRGGDTVGVIGTGLDRIYPKENRLLQERIGAEQLLVSMFPPGTSPRRGNFPQRNRLMALISDATVIVDAGETSGSLSQGWEALRLRRPLFYLRSLLDRGLDWPRKMDAYGARVLSDPDDLLGALPSAGIREAEDAPF